jgi:hypothetical protein
MKVFIYVLSNPAFPKLVKIGYSREIPDLRAEQLYTTGVPSPFKIEYYCVAEGGEALEAMIHDSLAHHRFRADREFFQVSVPFARAVIEKCCQPETYWVSDKHKAIRMSERMGCPRCATVYEDRLTCPECQIPLIAK